MCGRFVSAAPPDEVARYFSADLVAGTIADVVREPRWNVAPTDDVPVVMRTIDSRVVDTLRWGLVPWWAKDPKVGNRMINARAETVAANGAFKDAFRRRRCLVVADGFYEWTHRPGQKRKQPYFIHHPAGELYGFAGLWDEWHSGDGTERLRSCTIVTTAANDVVAALHDRMPVILAPSAWDSWLDTANDDRNALEHLLVPAPSATTSARPVSTAVGDVKSQGHQLIDEVDLVDERPTSGSTGGKGGGQGTLL